MFRFLRIAFAASLVALNTMIHTPILFLVVVFKLLFLPFRSIRDGFSRVLTVIAESWISVNSFLIRTLTPTQIVVHGDTENLSPNKRYLVLCNHRSWCDIPILQRVLNRRIPLLRFFLKQELIWVPLLGMAWWALDFPFMKRHSRATLLRNPELRTQDLDATRRACQKFERLPVSIMNFVEGTRFTAEKHRKQAPPFQHLLRPRAGGVAAVLDAMAGNLQSVLDITLIYRARESTLAALLAGELPQIEVHIRERPLPEELTSGGDYQEDTHYRSRCQRWVNTLWVEKDTLIQARLAEDIPPNA